MLNQYRLILSVCPGKDKNFLAHIHWIWDFNVIVLREHINVQKMTETWIWTQRSAQKAIFKWPNSKWNRIFFGEFDDEQTIELPLRHIFSRSFWSWYSACSMPNILLIKYSVVVIPKRKCCPHYHFPSGCVWESIGLLHRISNLFYPQSSLLLIIFDFIAKKYLLLSKTASEHKQITKMFSKQNYLSRNLNAFSLMNYHVHLQFFH